MRTDGPVNAKPWTTGSRGRREVRAVREVRAARLEAAFDPGEQVALMRVSAARQRHRQWQQPRWQVLRRRGDSSPRPHPRAAIAGGWYRDRRQRSSPSACHAHDLRLSVATGVDLSWLATIGTGGVAGTTIPPRIRDGGQHRSSRRTTGCGSSGKMRGVRDGGMASLLALALLCLFYASYSVNGMYTFATLEAWTRRPPHFFCDTCVWDAIIWSRLYVMSE